MKFSNEIKIGFTVIAAVLIGVVGFRVMKDVPILSGGLHLTSIFSKVDGLSAGKKIFFNGVDIGSILLVELMEDDSIKVTMTIDSETKIPIDSKAFIRSTDFLGSKAIIIEKGKSKKVVQDYSALKGVFDEGMLSELQTKGLSLGDKVAEVGENLNFALKNVNSTLSDGLKKDLAKSVKNFEQLTKETEAMVSANKEAVANSMKSLSKTLSTLDTLSAESKPEIKKLIQQMNEQMVKLDQVSSSLTQTSNELNILLKRINNGEGTLGKLATDASLYNQMDSLAFNLQKLIRNIDKDPKKYLQHIDIGLF